MSKKSRTRNVVLNFPASCVICGGAIDGDLSNDHFAPLAFARALPQSSRIGLIFPAHIDCNMERGHSPAGEDLIARAAAMLADMSTNDIGQACANIETVENTLFAHVEALRRLRANLGRKIERRAKK